MAATPNDQRPEQVPINLMVGVDKTTGEIVFNLDKPAQEMRFNEATATKIKDSIAQAVTFSRQMTRARNRIN